MKRAFGLSDDVLMEGPFRGRLANEGDRIAVQRLNNMAGLGGLLGPQLVWLEEDKIEYVNDASWPEPFMDGLFALSRRELGAFGNDPQNWLSVRPSPGNDSELPPIVRTDRLIQGISLDDGMVHLRLKLQSEIRYQVQYADEIERDVWKLLQRVAGEGDDVVVRDEASSGQSRFYRVIVENVSEP